MNISLNKYNKIIFDLDGVITSEFVYWDSAALAVYELLFSQTFYGGGRIKADLCYEHCAKIRSVILNDDKTVYAVKNLGVNTNWDLAMVVFCVSQILNPNIKTLDVRHFQDVCAYIKNIKYPAPELYTFLEDEMQKLYPREKSYYAREAGTLWKNVQHCFQHWLLGSKKYHAFYGIPANPLNRAGLTFYEKPVIPIEDIQNVLEILKNRGIRLGIGTGRPLEEAESPLLTWGILKYFDRYMIATYTEVRCAEKSLLEYSALAKPHPFVFLKAAFGEKYSDFDLLAGKHTAEDLTKILVVGDTPSDLLACRSAGFDFAAVLTGAGNREYFESMGVEHIWESIVEAL